MNLTTNLAFKSMEDHIIHEFSKKIPYNININNLSGYHIDISSINKKAIELLFNDGDFLPEVIYYWAALTFEVIKNADLMGYDAYWLNLNNNTYYELSVNCLLELMNDTFSWENNNFNLALVWGNINIMEVFQLNTKFEGIIIPVDNGLGVISDSREIINYLIS